MDGVDRTDLPAYPALDTLRTTELRLHRHQAVHESAQEDRDERLTTDKELLVAPGAGHVDLYHRTDLIPFESIDVFLAKHLG